MKSLLQLIDRVNMRPHEAWALATVVETRGSTYRKPGARMLIDASGGTCGVVSGGCLEDEIARVGRRIVSGAPPELLEFDTRRLYGCHGVVRILVEALPPALTSRNFLTQLGETLERREVCRLRTCYEGESPGTTLLPAAELVIERPSVFIHCVPLPVRLLLLGMGPEVEPLTQIAHTLGWLTRQFASAADLPDDLKPDSQTAALVMMHHFGRDLAALERILPLGLQYVGLLGPRKRYWQLLQELHSLPSFDPETSSVIFAPAGLDIGSEAPEEIAISLVAEISTVLSGRAGGHLRDRATAIHFAKETSHSAQAA